MSDFSPLFLLLSVLVLLIFSPCVSMVDGAYAGEQSHTPQWFTDGVFGIFIHYGVYSVPAYAPLTDPFAYGSTTLLDTFSDKPYPALVNNTYAAWYWNSMMINGSATQIYHQKTYGDLSYQEFFPVFEEENAKLNMDDWKKIMQSARANYAVLTSVHHDGYNLFPSRAPHPYRHRTSTCRDIVGEYMRSLRDCNPSLSNNGPGNYCIEPGIYVSTGYRWEFNGVGFSSVKASLEHVLQSTEYSRYLEAQFDQLINDYKPAYFWGDWGSPRSFNLSALIEKLDTAVGSKAMINDRFTQQSIHSFFNLFPTPIGAPLRDLTQEKFNILSLEYKSLASIINYSPYRFEMTRGMARDFSYNINENIDDPYLLSAKDILEILLMTSANNGNFLLGITPMANGTIPSHQITILEETGKYLDQYGEAIFKTIPCAQNDLILRAHFINNEKENYGRFCTKSTIRPDTYYITYIEYDINANSRLNEICVPLLSSIFNLFLSSSASRKVINLISGEIIQANYQWTKAAFCIPLPADRSMPITFKIQKKIIHHQQPALLMRAVQFVMISLPSLLLVIMSCVSLSLFVICNIMTIIIYYYCLLLLLLLLLLLFIAKRIMHWLVFFLFNCFFLDLFLFIVRRSCYCVLIVIQC